MKDLSPPCAVTIWKEMLIPVFGIHFQRASLFNKSGCFLFLCLFLGECPQSLMSQFDRFWRGGGFFHLEALNDLPFGESQIGFQLRLDKDDSSQLGTMLACSFSQNWRRQSRSGPRLGVGEGRGHEVGVLKPRILGNLTWATGSKIRPEVSRLSSLAGRMKPLPGTIFYLEIVLHETGLKFPFGANESCCQDFRDS